MNKPDLTLNNPQWIICHKTKPNQTRCTHCVRHISNQLKETLTYGQVTRKALL